MRLRRLLSSAGDQFWLVPGAMVLAGVLLAVGLVELDRSGAVPRWLVESPWLYNGGGTGARTLLGAVASSTIGVAGTVFSITIASLSLAAGQMGPRLLRAFVRDRGNQTTLGAFLGTFSYALMVLRSVRTRSEGEFIPHLALSIGILLAFVCVVTLVLFVGHTAWRINVDTVLDLVSNELTRAIRRLTCARGTEAAPEPALPPDPVAVVGERRGYLQHLDADRLADWAHERGAFLKLLVRPGDYLFPGAAVALLAQTGGDADGLADEAGRAIRRATALAPQRVSDEDLEYPIRQLVEVGVRALSPGINDPHTAMSVLDRLGAALCDLAPRALRPAVLLRDGRPALVMSTIDYDGLTDAMFHMVRQNAADSPPVLIRLLEVLTVAAGVERDPARLRELARHADLVLRDAEREVGNPADLDDVRVRHRRFGAMVEMGPVSSGGS